MVDILELNNWLNNRKNGYIGSGKVNWWALDKYLDANIKFVESSDIEYIAKLNDELTKGYPMILKVFNSKTGRYHFVITVGKSGETWDIIDPGYQPQKTILAERYGNRFQGIRVYEPV
ncbi:MAG: hypothetical protein ACOYU0_04125 [Nitrospirota bacterium]